ncbi:phosphonate ABC transporter substrate-binding protein [Methylobacterium sp. E-066]|uniref:phosphonate ABC transporter substrate-binding protein n=1 Tax=Methylobacterium sp. E-066 TaxID=2836584 RepID=UPI001FB999B5|nr:phosphonate ABC transporter substrate-binding protein [Methylobacterium sp. E-066]MCJ2139303.1 phosphonate ABC transporter substrate-binding protein [Methylobacterium sp. E-066]
MTTRRTVVAAAISLALFGWPAAALDWKAQVPELTLAVVPVENATPTTERHAPLVDYLTRKLGVPVKLRVAKDYAAVIEGQRAGAVHIAWYGPASYAQAVLNGVKIQPLVTQRHENGSTGYNAVIYVLATSLYQSVEDLKGKTLALVDPDSTSGNQAPRYFLKRAGFDLDKHFGKTFFAGSHENAVVALAESKADAAANYWTSDSETMVTRLAGKGLLKAPDGKPMSQSDFRIVFKSDFLPYGPFAVLASLPIDLKAEIRAAFMGLPQEDKAAFDRLSDGKDIGFAAVKLADYEPIVEMLRFNREQH